jgi:hypothetical protein
MSKPVHIFTPATIERIREMKLAGASFTEIAEAIGSKSGNAVKAGCSQLGVKHPAREDIAEAA